MTPPTRQQDAHVLVIAGEASGDRHAARLIEEIHRLRPSVRFSGIGGDRMREQRVEILYDASQMSVVGFIEVVKRYRFFRSVLRHIVRHASEHHPALAILVDYPGFNLRLARELHRLGIPVVYYIAPQVWAWKEGRVETLRRYVDDLIVVFPFEVEYFADRGITAHFFGHPLVDQFDGSARDRLENDHRPTIAYLPGSRPDELRRHMPEICRVITRMGDDYRHVIPLAPTLDRSALEQYRSTAGFDIVEDAASALSNADAALVKSGTSTVEAMMHGVPFAVFYRTSNITYQIARRAITVSSIAMVNLLAGHQIVREFIQDDVTADKLEAELGLLLHDEEYRSRIVADLCDLAKRLGEPGAASRAAEYITSRYL